MELKKVMKLDYDTVTTVVADILEGENDLFNNYQEYDVTNIENNYAFKKYNVNMIFSNDIWEIEIFEYHDNDIVEYAIV